MCKMRLSFFLLLSILMAAIFLSCGNGKFKVEKYARITRIKPTQADAYYNLGIAYSIVEREQSALDAFQKVVHLNPDDPEAYFNLGELYMISDHNEEAVTAYSKAFNLGQIHTKHYRLGLAYHLLGRNEESSKEFIQAIDENEPHPLTSYYTLGLARYDMGQYEKAVEAFNTALSINPSFSSDYYNIYYSIAKTCKKLGREDDAVAAYREALRHRPDFIPSYIELGLILIKRGNYNDTMNLYEQLRSVNADSAAVLNDLIRKSRK